MKDKSMSQQSASFSDKLKSYPLYFLPHHLISRIVFKLTRIKSPMAQPVMRWFIKQFKIEMDDAKIQDLSQFKNFNEFFTRELKDNARPITNKSNSIASPVDARISQIGKITQGRIFQAKGQDYSLKELLGGDCPQLKEFENGHFTTLYLSPSDYHRIHMPIDGKLVSQVYIPGRLFSVASHTARTVPRLFSRNERVVAFFDTDAGPMAMILVGAINVAAIETVWSGLVTPPNGKTIKTEHYPPESAASLSKGSEMGRFNMGSTVILVFNPSIQWESPLESGMKVKLGELLGQY